MSISEHKHVAEPGLAQRIEVFTGTGRRRTWTAEPRAAIVAESYAEGVTACQVAPRSGLTAQRLRSSQALWVQIARSQDNLNAGAVRPNPFSEREPAHLAGQTNIHDRHIDVVGTQRVPAWRHQSARL
jgi:hypothetical protein